MFFFFPALYPEIMKSIMHYDKGIQNMLRKNALCDKLIFGDLKTEVAHTTEPIY